MAVENYFIINLRESMGQGRDRTRTPGSAARHVSAVRHVTDCAMWPSQHGCLNKAYAQILCKNRNTAYKN